MASYFALLLLPVSSTYILQAQSLKDIVYSQGRRLCFNMGWGSILSKGVWRSSLLKYGASNSGEPLCTNLCLFCINLWWKCPYLCKGKTKLRRQVIKYNGI